eukprot:4508897-Alexandrium_andersonii.AAC.1
MCIRDRWRQVHIPKDDVGACDVERFRPIAIASACLRAWRWIRARQMSDWILPAVPASMAGGFRNRTVSGP